MAIRTKEILKSYFETGDKPTESQFADLIDSLVHINEAQSSTSVMRYPKDETITEEHIGRLAMHKKEPVTTEGEIILAIRPTGFMLLLDNVTGGGFAFEEVINQGSTTGIIMGMFPVGGDLWFALINVTSGTFETGQVIENEGETVSANVISVLPNLPEINSSVFLYGDTPKAIATVTAVNGFNVTVEPIAIFGDITETEVLFIQGEEENALPILFSSVDAENSTFPEVTGGEDIATLCQTTPATDGVKMEFELRIKGLINVTRPTTKVIRVTFNGDNIQDGQILRISKVSDDSQIWELVFKDTAEGEGECQIGATLSDTLDNLETKLENTEDVNSLFFKIVDRNGSTSIDIEILEKYRIYDTSNPHLGYHTDCYFSQNLGDDSVGGFATYSVVRELENPELATDIANVNINGKIVSYTQSIPSQSFGFLMFWSIYTWSELTQEEMGLVWFVNGEDFKDAVVAALENEYEDLFNSNFEIVNSSWNSETEEAVIRIRKKASFNTTLYYSFNTFLSDNVYKEVDVQTVVYPTLTISKMVRGMVLGEVVGIDDNQVLIDRALLQSAILAGEEEGITTNAVEVYHADVQGLANEVHAWDNGKVINLVNLYEIAGNNSTVMNNVRAKSFLLGGAFMPLTPGNGNIEGKQRIKVSRSTPITNQTH